MKADEPDAGAIPLQEQVLLIPAHVFFVDYQELPAGLEGAEVANFAELTLESLSPFPLEQLYWGYLRETEGRGLLLYATRQERLKELGFTDLPDYLWVLPDFACLAALDSPAAGPLIIESAGSAALADLPGDQVLPKTLLARTDRSQLPADLAGAAVLFVAGTSLSERGRLRFSLQTRADPDGRFPADSWEPPGLPESTLWAADLRTPAFKQSERNRRQLAALIGRAMVFSAAAACLLLVFELALLVGDAWLGTRQAKVAEQLPEVRRVEDKQSLMNKLDQVAQSELRPIAMLEALNQNRPDGIYFTNTVTEGRNRITVDGIANTINELNAYTEALRQSGSFELIGPPQSITRSGRTTFTVTLDYFHREPPAAAAAAETES